MQAGSENSQLETANQPGNKNLLSGDSLNKASDPDLAGSGADSSSDAGTSVRSRGSDSSFNRVDQNPGREARRNTADGTAAVGGSGAAPWKKEIGKQNRKQEFAGVLQEIPDCDQGRLDVGSVCKLNPADVDGGVRANRASSGAKLYRCIRIDGNPLAPPAELTGKDVDATSKAQPAESDLQAKDGAAQRAVTENTKSGLHQHVCLPRQQSAIACGEQEVLCEITSAPVSFVHKQIALLKTQ